MNNKKKTVCRLLAGIFSVLLVPALILIPLCNGYGAAGTAGVLVRNGSAGEKALGMLLLLTLPGSLLACIFCLLPRISDTAAARAAVISAAFSAALCCFVNWLCVGSAQRLAGVFGAETVSFRFCGYLVILIAALVLSFTLAFRAERVVKRDDMPKGTAMLIRLAAILAAMLVSMLMILMIGYDPLAVLYQIYYGSVGNPAALTITLERSIPLVLSMLAVVVSFRMHFWNVGVGGQFTMGAVFAAFFAYHFGTSLPHVPLMAIMFAAGALGGALWGLLPALAKVKWGTSETLFALMLNYVSTYIVQFLRRGPWEDPMMPSFGQCPMFDANARLSKVAGVSSGWIAALILLMLIAVYLRYTKHGFEITVVGEQSRTAEYAGLRVGRIILRTMLLSGAIAGAAGMLKISGADFKMNETIAGEAGFSAITIAWLSKLNPITGAAVALLFSAMSKGCESLSMSTTLRVNGVSIPSASATVIIGIILLFVLGCEFFISYRVIMASDNREGDAAK